MGASGVDNEAPSPTTTTARSRPAVIGAAPTGWPRRLAVGFVLALAAASLAVAVAGGGRPDAGSAGGPVAEGVTSSGAHDHDEHGVNIAPHPLAPAVQRTLDGQLAVAEASITSWRTAGEAVADGFVWAGGEADQNDAHLLRWDRMDGRFDVAAPEMLIATDRSSSARIIAVAYYVLGDTPVPPDGFAGDNDHWHEHAGICTVGDRLVSGDFGSDPVACKKVGGVLGKADGWMLHAWIVPGDANPDGVFATENPNARRSG